MAIEIDFLPVGGASKSGDAICVRYGEIDSFGLCIVDGGDLAAGKRLVEHLQATFGKDVAIADVVCTHPDGDHASGLRVLLEHVPVGNLWVHQPWLYASALNPKFAENWTDANLAQHLREDCFAVVADLCDLAQAKGVTLREPLAGATIGPFTVLAPSRDRWLDLVPKMEQTPAEKMVSQLHVLEKLFKAATATVLSILESWSWETLKDPSEDATSVPNETSVVLLGQDGDNRILLTGDAGVGALSEAKAIADYLQLPITSPSLVQMPHHGSRHNVGPTMLDAILGERLAIEGETRGWAVGSVAEKCEKRPYRSVLNAFKRRGYACAATKGRTLNYNDGFPARAGVTPIESEPFHSYVED